MMAHNLNIQRHVLVERYTSTTLEVLGSPAVEDRLGNRQPELVALVNDSFTAERRRGRLVLSSMQQLQNNVGVHPILRRDLTLPNYDSFINTPVGDSQERTGKDAVARKALDAVFGLYPRIFDANAIATTTRGKTTHRDLIQLHPRVEAMAPVHMAAVVTHEFDHVRANRELDRRGIELSYDNDPQLAAGEKAAFQVSEAILAADPSLPKEEIFEAFWAAVKDADTPSIAVERASQISDRLASTYPDGSLGRLLSLVYGAKALSLRFGNEEGPVTATEVEAYKLYGLS